MATTLQLAKRSATFWTHTSVDKILETPVSMTQYNSTASQTATSKILQLNQHLSKTVSFSLWGRIYCRSVVLGCVNFRQVYLINWQVFGAHASSCTHWSCIWRKLKSGNNYCSGLWVDTGTGPATSEITPEVMFLQSKSTHVVYFRIKGTIFNC